MSVVGPRKHLRARIRRSLGELSQSPRLLLCALEMPLQPTLALHESHRRIAQIASSNYPSGASSLLVEWVLWRRSPRSGRMTRHSETAASRGLSVWRILLTEPRHPTLKLTVPCPSRCLRRRSNRLRLKPGRRRPCQSPGPARRCENAGSETRAPPSNG